MAGEAAGAGVSGSNQEDICWKTGAFIAAFDAHFAFFKGLTQALESRPLKLGKFVEEQHAAVRARELARAKWSATAKESLSRDAVMRSAEWCTLGKRVYRTMQ